MGALDPVTVESDWTFDDESNAPPDDRDELCHHRATVLARQGTNEAEVVRSTSSPRSARGELALAILYTLCVVPMGYITLKHALGEGQLLAAVGVVLSAVVFLSLVWFWRSYQRAAVLARSTRAYEGVLLETRMHGNERVGALAAFEGGGIYLPHAVARELRPGVRYRVHAAGTEHVLVDVALDEIDHDAGEQTAYRSLRR